MIKTDIIGKDSTDKVMIIWVITKTALIETDMIGTVLIKMDLISKVIILKV